MRIRSIRPEFWSSEDIAGLSWDQRLIYIGLWSYVDDNGVGRDVDKLILADLFPLDDDGAGALTAIRGALSEYSKRQMITRYEVDGKRYLHITAWEKHQKINRPSEGRYPLPTREDAVIHDALTEPSLSPQVKGALGEGEKGRRGEGEKAAQQRGTRLPADWIPPEADRVKMAAERPDLDILREHENFVDHWIAQPGQKGLKLDWPATWRKWMRSAYANKQQPNGRRLEPVPAYETPPAPDRDSLPAW